MKETARKMEFGHSLVQSLVASVLCTVHLLLSSSTLCRSVEISQLRIDFHRGLTVGLLPATGIARSSVPGYRVLAVIIICIGQFVLGKLTVA